MSQERFVEAEYFTEFDPEKFLRDLKAHAAEEKESEEQHAERDDENQRGGAGEQHPS